MGNKPLNNNEEQPATGMSNPFYQPDLEAGQVGEVLSEFTFKSFYHDPYFQDCRVLEHRRSHELIILKELSYSNQEEMEVAYDEFQKRKQRLIGDNIIRLRYLMKKHSQGLIRDQWKILLLFDYILIDMHTEARNRIRMNTKFSNEELSTILAGAVKGYASVEREGIPNDKVRLKNIYFGLKDQIPIVKIADSNLFPSKSNFLAVADGDRDQQDIFLAPEEVRALATGQRAFSNPKSGVYSLGMAVLELCLQNQSRQIYHYGARTMNLKEVEERLNIIRNKYPLGFFYVLKEMTEKSVEHRVSFQQLQSKLPSNLKNYSPNMTLSVIPRSQVNSSYVKDSVIHHLSSIHGPLASNSQLVNSRPGVLSSNRVLVSAVLPGDQVQSTLTSQYRPMSTFNLHEVNEVYTNGNTYKGQKNGQDERHGKGKYTYEDGSFYYGDWYRNKMFGSGTLYYNDKSVEYDGEWKDDMFEGRGVLYGKACDWIKYEGEFKAGKMEGYGTMLFNDGNTYTGSFKADRPHGRGRLVKREGTTQIGVWDHGKMLGLE